MATTNNNNARTHGLYAKLDLQAEDVDEFDNLHQSLIDEWKPEGPTERNCVFFIACEYWRKRELESFHKEQFSLLQISDVEQNLKKLEVLARDIREITDEDKARMVIGLLPKQYQAFIERKFDRSKFPDTQAWIEALGSSAFPRLLAIQERVAWAEENDRKIQVEKMRALLETADAQIKRDERIIARIEKHIKMLAMAKTLKEAVVAQKPRPKMLTDSSR